MRVYQPLSGRTAPVDVTIGALAAEQEAQLARAVVLAFDLDLPLLG